VDDALRWAVTDGADGTRVVVLPAEPAADRLGAHPRSRFWCATQAGGCGERLTFTPAGFRHADEDSWCRFARQGSDAERAYEHLRYEPALRAWLAGQGWSARVRLLPGPGGAVDLSVVVEEVDAVLEVQLSPLADAAWRERDDADRRQHRHVTWLYGPVAGAAATTEAAVRGTSLELRRQGRGLVVGVRDADGATRWVPLAACRLTADGFVAPGIEEAQAVHRRRAGERQEAARRAAGHGPRTAVPEQLAFPM
jgi:hypothetical protein